MTHEEKWKRIAVVQSRMRDLDAEWDNLSRQLSELLMHHTPLPKKRLTWEQAEERARQVHELAAQKLTQTEIAARLGIARSLVAQYMQAGCKAALRAGVVK